MIDITKSINTVYKAKLYCMLRKLYEEKEKIDSLNLKGDLIRNAFKMQSENYAHKNPETLKDYDRFYKKFIVRFNGNEFLHHYQNDR